MSTRTYETADEFYEDADWPSYAIRDGEYMWWLAWNTEDGDWFAARPMHEDDAVSDVDPYRPIGPTPLEDLKLPWLSVALDDLAPDEVEATS